MFGSPPIPLKFSSSPLELLIDLLHELAGGGAAVGGRTCVDEGEEEGRSEKGRLEDNGGFKRDPPSFLSFPHHESELPASQTASLGGQRRM